MILSATWGIPSFASAVEVFGRVDKTSGTMEDQFYLTITIQDTTDANPPQLPPIEGFQVRAGGQSSQTQWINGKVSSKIDYRYILFPQRIGTFRIPAISIEIEDSILETQPIEIIVGEAQSVPQTERPIYVESSLSSTKVYLNQPILYSFEVYVQQGIRTSNLQFERPNFDNFQVTERGEPKTVQRVLQGKGYEVTTVQFVLYPLKTGTQQIGSGVLVGQQLTERKNNFPFGRGLSGFSMFNSQAKPIQLQSQPLLMEVLPFPEANQPADFSGLVGKYSMAVSASAKQLQIGESATVTVTIQGEGKAEWVTPRALQVDDSMKIYADQPVYENRMIQEKSIGIATFTYAMVPSAQGRFEVNISPLVVFDPLTQQYEQIQAESFAVNVQQSQNGEDALVIVGDNDAQKQVVKRLADDLLPIYKEVSFLKHESLDLSYSLLTLFFIPPFAVGLLLWWQKQKENSIGNQNERRNSQAAKNLKKKINHLQSEDTVFSIVIEQCLLFFREYIGDKKSAEGTAMTSREILQWLAEKGISVELKIHIQAWIEKMEMAQYAGHVEQSTNAEKVVQELLEIVDSIETSL